VEYNNTPIPSDIVEEIIKNNHIFNNIAVALKLCIIKVFPKSNIWDVQSDTNAKELINRCFNIGNHIATIQGTNMNPEVPQCKNCWKWEHSIFSCRAQGSKCIKCNGPHKMEYHYQFAECCKANAKMNPLRLKMKQCKLCLYTFKYLNCKGKHQANSNVCSF